MYQHPGLQQQQLWDCEFLPAFQKDHLIFLWASNLFYPELINFQVKQLQIVEYDSLVSKINYTLLNPYNYLKLILSNYNNSDLNITFQSQYVKKKSANIFNKTGIRKESTKFLDIFILIY